MDRKTEYERRWATLGVLCLSLVMIVAANTSLNVALPTLVKDLHASGSALQWVVDAYSLVFAGLLLTAGSLGDRYGRRLALNGGLVVFGAASAVAAFSGSSSALIVARVVMGIGAAFVMPATLSILAHVFPPAERRRAIAIWAGFAGIGAVTGNLLSGWLLQNFWWGSVFLINVPVTIIGAIAAWVLVPESRNREAGRIDYVGVLLSIAGLVTLVYGIVQGGDGASWLSRGVLGPIVGGLAILAAFAAYEARIEHPSLDVRLFRDRRLSASIGSLGLVFFGMGGVFFFTSFYLQNVRGYTPLAAGLLTVPFAAGQLLMSPRSARMVQRYGAKAVGATGMFVMAAAIAGYATLGTASPIWLLGVLFGIQGAAIGVSMPAATAAVMDVLPRERAGAGSALTNTARQVAVALSVAILGSILAEFYRNSLSPSLTGLPAATRSVASSSITATQAVAQQLGSAGRSLLGPANDAYVHAMHITALVAAVLVVAGGFVVLRWMPGKPKPAAEIAAPSADSYESELAIMEENVLNTASREG